MRGLTLSEATTSIYTALTLGSFLGFLIFGARDQRCDFPLHRFRPRHMLPWLGVQ